MSSGETYRRYRARRSDCAACPRHRQCLQQGPQRKSLAFLVEAEPATLSGRMRRKIDQPEARRIYSRRLAIVEPVFANLRRNKRLDRFTNRGQVKVNIQWLLYCLVHNFEKLAHRSKAYGRTRPFCALRRATHRLFRRLPSLRETFSPKITPFCSLRLSFET